MKIIQAIGAFGNWWHGQLVSLVPDAVKSALGSLRIRHRISVEQDGITLLRRGWLASPGNWKQIDGIFQQPKDVTDLFRPRFGALGFRRKVNIVVPVEQLLTRSVELPLSVAANISDIAALEARALVPGSGKSAYSGLDVASIKAGSQSVSARQLVLNGELVEPYVAALKADKGLDFEVTALLKDGREVRLDPLMEASAEPVTGTRWRLILAALVLVLGAANIFTTLTRQEEAITALDQKLVIATRKAQTVRNNLNREAALANGVVGIQKKIQHEPGLIDIWQELTKTLPRSAWINALAIEDRTLRMTGSAKSAAELIGLLEASVVFSQVRFSSPVVTNRASNDERFQIEARIGTLP
ncbi:PilN domain-containing protein [Anderseniella sp. Alg231-50]|uniref:PilN domain-containing protein n=1 Tax=Anderseniella sp. Alg231-50 TaxID=1922226 RepID=UPI000D54F87D